MEAQAISEWVAARSAEYGQALRFILSSGARINEALQLRADKVFLADSEVELLGKGGRIVIYQGILIQLLSASSSANYRQGASPVIGKQLHSLSARCTT